MNILDSCKVYTIGGVEVIHISEFARITHRTVQSSRHLVEGDNTAVRKMKAFRDRSRLMIPIIEIFGYPLTSSGQGGCKNQRNIYHYAYDENGELQKTFCEKCTFGEPCEARQKADALVLPEGDK